MTTGSALRILQRAYARLTEQCIMGRQLFFRSEAPAPMPQSQLLDWERVHACTNPMDTC